MIGFFAGRSFGSPLASKPSSTCGDAEIGQHLADRRVERELALLDQLHGRGRRDRLGHRGDPEHAVRGHGVVLGQVAFAERALIDHFLAGRGHRDHAGNFPGVAFLTQHLIDLSFALAWRPSRLIFLKSADLPPGRGFPQARGRAGCRGRDLVMLRGGNGVERGRTATLAIICGGLACIAGDLRGISAIS